ncbi:hypothetical protein [Pedobacter sp. N23S346]|uniref:hypothetical protein n=1 Tax=Pedobacter sp. N23S346 TaxID=3402750 RepID=UPI003ACCBB5E
MKKVTLIAIFGLSAISFSCKQKTANNTAGGSDTNAATEQPVTDTAAPVAQGNAPKTYTATFTPDSALLGKQKEAFVKVIPVSATDLSDPDRKSEGIEFTFKISVTNKNKIGGSSVFVGPADFRLTLDNNTAISRSEGGGVSVEAESTKESELITFRIPAGTKPKALNLFYDETRASVGVSLQ